MKAQPAWKAEVGKVFRKVDFIAMPTMKTLPPHVPLFGGTVAFEARALALQNTQAVNFGGQPGTGGARAPARREGPPHEPAIDRTATGRGGSAQCRAAG